ncbi:hypothetical protein, partial [Vibrio sp.]|uniref:hypothetical protein n=1 Tax=Vibrio sp. TaxID=678 RepID=UPI003D1017F1
MYGAFGPCQNYRLVSLDVNDGTTVYDKPIKVPSILGISNVVYNSQYVYFGYKGSKAVEDSTIGSGGISAYTVEAGEPVWTYTISGASLVRSIVASDSYLAVDGGTDKYYLLNASTGNVIKTLEKKFEPGTPIGPSVNFAFWYDYIL